MRKALIVYGGWAGHDPEGVAKVFGEILEEENFEVTFSDTLEAFLQDLSVYHLIVPVWTMGTLSGEEERNVCRAVADGVGLAGCHGGMCDAFRNNIEWQFMTGAQWVAHPGNGDVTYTVNIKVKDNFITKGIKDFSVTSEQYYIHVDPAIKVLATTTFPIADGNHVPNGKVEMPVVFTKMWGKGKVFYNSLGHDRHTFEIEEIKELMRRGFLYVAKGE